MNITRTNVKSYFAIALIAAVAAASLPAKAQQAASGSLPLAAESWGGIVRSGAGSNHPEIASLREGDPVTLLARTGVMWNDYEWFKIRFHGGRIGYQWGGILCPLGMAVQGTYEVCQAGQPMPQ